MKQQKGITLIALVITIIVLLILAGVTIAMLTGSDSAPVKANEAKQKQDIGAYKDQVFIWAQDAQTTAYENVYVKGLQASGSTGLKQGKDKKANDVGTYVGTTITSKVSSASDVGLASIKNDTNSDTKKTAKFTISTTDFQLTGWINLDAGTLEWDPNGIITKTK